MRTSRDASIGAAENSNLIGSGWRNKKRIRFSAVPAAQFRAMEKRRRFKQTTSLKDRLAAFAEQARAKARIASGPERDDLIRKARRADTAAHIDEWASSSGLQPPTPYTDAESARRFRDKAAEALQMANLAETEARRNTLVQIASSYEKVAANLEGMALSPDTAKK